MRLVLDTNVVVAGLLWNGAPRRLLETAIDAGVELFTSPALIQELGEALAYRKFVRRLTLQATTVEALVDRYVAIATSLVPASIPRAVPNDPDDDQVLATALTAQADLIVSGDSDLQALGIYQGIPIVSPAECVRRLNSESRE